MTRNRLTLVFMLSLLTAVAAVTADDRSGGAPTNPFQPCPDRPNCVRSDSIDTTHAIAPITYTGDRAAVIKRIEAFFASETSAPFQRRSDTMFHIEVSSSLFKFIDDVSIFVPLNTPSIHIRSASRSGYYDFGVNRRRMERLRRFLTNDSVSE